MKIASTFRLAAWGAAILAALLPSCGGSGGGGVSVLGSEGGVAADETTCDQACSALIACGVPYDAATCATDCLASSEFLTCARPLGGSDCNALALCAFKESAAESCSGGVGVPAGTASCSDYRSCNGGCFSLSTVTEADTCICDCASTLAPSKAINGLIEDECGPTLCAAACTPPGSAADCAACQSAMCASQQQQCVDN
jgi:hypothetical protein